MSVDELIDGLSAEAREAMRGLLRQAYDLGFREALATAGQPPVATTPPERPAPAPTPTPAPVAWAGGAEVDGGDPPEDGDEDGDDDPNDADEAPVQRPILPHATIGTLRRRIVRTFDLERFDIDVVICRSGDPDRRQLQNRARLRLYRREEA